MASTFPSTSTQRKLRASSTRAGAESYCLHALKDEVRAGDGKVLAVVS